MKTASKHLIVRSAKALIAALAVAACGTTVKNGNTGKVNQQTIAAEELAVVASPATADISFTGQDGVTLSLSELKGKVVFINFWATWCPPCIYEMPSINELKQSFKGNDDIVFLMVDVDSEMEKSSAFMRDNNYDLPVYVPASAIPSDYLGGAIPTTVILDKSGDIIARVEGGRDYRDPQIVRAIQSLVEQE